MPLFNEELNVDPLVDAVAAALPRTLDWELILVDDGSSDGTPAVAASAARADRRVRLLRLARNYGQTPAMQAGFRAARGDIIVTMDGDLQNDPRDIPRLLEKLGQGYDLVAGYRVKRRDHALRRKIPSWVANRIMRRLTGVDITDNGCSLKAYRSEMLRKVHLYSDMHRFIPAVAAGTTGARIAEIPVRHYARRFGSSKYGLSRIPRVLADILTITMIRSYKDRPLLLFGAMALAAGAAGAAFAAAAVVAILWFQPSKSNAVVFPTAAALWFGVAVYLLMLGLVSESLLQRRARGRASLPLVRERRHAAAGS